ncbi:RHS repeat protein [Salmonella enterica subsp. enterica]|nr:RHS repeat protein [Salmonella enterica subsp. enterica]
MYAPGSFTPLVRIETDAAEQAKAQHRSLAEKLSQEGSEDGQAVQLPAALTAMLDRLEGELRRNAVSEESRAWLAGCGLTPEQMAEQLEPEYTPQRKIHLYHCDQRGLPLALITPDNTVAWRGEYDEWGNLSGEENPADLEQLIRLPGQQYDEESGLYYNRHRYYNPGQGRYITQDPIGLKGGWNVYLYPLNPITEVDPLGLWAFAIPAILEGINWLFWGSAAAGSAVLATPSDSEKSKNTDSSNPKQRTIDHRAYKQRCNEPPPPGLGDCPLAEWKLNRKKDCRNMRQAWDDKYSPGQHAKDIFDLDKGITKLTKFIEDECS